MADGIAWCLPDGYGELSHLHLVGYMYGAAGIADSLLYLGEATGEYRYIHAAIQVTQWILSLSHSTLSICDSICWPRYKDGPIAFNNCGLGSIGIGKYLLHAYQAGICDDAYDYVVRIA